MAETPNPNLHNPLPTSPSTASRPRSLQTNTPLNGQLSGLQVMFAVILAIGLLLAINFSRRIADGKPLLDAYEKVKAEIEDLQLEQATLTSELEYVSGAAYVEQWARDNGKMVRPGERLIIPVPVGAMATATTPVNLAEQAFDSGIPTSEPWHLWWSLFFDSAPPNAPAS
jgi:cell division protein FtsB